MSQRTSSHRTPVTSDMSLRGRHAFITGGGRGIGAAIANELARLGARVTVVGRDTEALEHTTNAVSSAHGAEIAALRCDVTDGDSVRGAFAQARTRFGDIEILVNNAGIGEGHKLHEMPFDVWEKTLAVNLTGAFRCMQEAIPPMLAAKWGRIVNIASTAGLRGYARMAAYGASKHGLIGLTKTAAVETAKFGITVNAVCPGYTDTDMVQQAVDALVAGRGVSPEEALEMVVRVNPRGVLIQPEEVASLVGWLCGPQASGVTGQAIGLTGGEV